ncbi:hypothetical protein LEP1GSC081_3364 [Leptospira kirschneri str. H1]|uniref:Uncharacterized protein n=1 Tax=Leptospira kirschneri str. H1 TaxID=1049966 RepID=A0A0E2B3J0_9LEPT|nr:hypothetical protein LEP1GSC081_3364 [Leptospira kirschneri str. H1]
MVVPTFQESIYQVQIPTFFRIMILTSCSRYSNKKIER